MPELCLCQGSSLPFQTSWSPGSRTAARCSWDAGGSTGPSFRAWRICEAAGAVGSPPSLQPHGGLRASLWLGRCWSWVVAVPVPTSLHPLSTSPVNAGMDFHKELHRIETKEGLRGRKLQKALESFAWNITVLKVSGRGCADTPALPCPAPSLSYLQPNTPRPPMSPPRRARLTSSSTPRRRHWTTCGRSTMRDSPAALAGTDQPRRSPLGCKPRWSPSLRQTEVATLRPADPGLGLGAQTEHPWSQGPGAGSPSLPGERGCLCHVEGLAPEFSGEVEERWPCSLFPCQAPRGLIHPLHLLLEPVLSRGASGDAGTSVPMCMYPQPAVPDATWKSSPRSGLLPTLPRATGLAFTSPGENLAGRKDPGWSVTSVAFLGSPLYRGPERLSGAADVGPGCP